MGRPTSLLGVLLSGLAACHACEPMPLRFASLLPVEVLHSAVLDYGARARRTCCASCDRHWTIVGGVSSESECGAAGRLLAAARKPPLPWLCRAGSACLSGRVCDR